MLSYSWTCLKDFSMGKRTRRIGSEALGIPEDFTTGRIPSFLNSQLEFVGVPSSMLCNKYFQRENTQIQKHRSHWPPAVVSAISQRKKKLLFKLEIDNEPFCHGGLSHCVRASLWQRRAISLFLLVDWRLPFWCLSPQFAGQARIPRCAVSWWCHRSCRCLSAACSWRHDQLLRFFQEASRGERRLIKMGKHRRRVAAHTLKVQSRIVFQQNNKL